MYVEGGVVDGGADDGRPPVKIGGIDNSGNVQTLLVGTDGSIGTTPTSLGQATMANSAPVVIASDQSAVTVALAAATNATSTALEASHVIKAGAGTLWSLWIYNSKTAPQYVQLHNTTSLPSDTAVPVWIPLYVPALSSLGVDFGIRGRPFATGITVCNSSTAGTKTIGSADCWFDAQYT